MNVASPKIPAAVQRFFSGIRLPHRPSKRDAVTLIASFFVAFIIWVYIASTVNPNITIEIQDIPVIVDMTGSTAEKDFGLSLLTDNSGDDEDEITKVTAVITGNRTAIGSLTRNDIEAYVDFDSDVRNMIGAQTLPIKLRTVNGAEISSYKLSESQMTVTMDRYDEVEIPVKEVLFPHLTYDSETIINEEEIAVEPSTVKVYGPTSQLSSIHHICVTIDEAEELTETKTFTNCTNYDLVATDGSPVSSAAFRVQASSFSVKIPVKYTRVLPVTVDISNAPAGFDKQFVLDRIRLKTQQEESFTLAGGENPLTIAIETSNTEAKAKLDALETWTIGTVSLYAISIDNKIDIPVTMEEGFTDGSQIGTVSLSLDSTGLIADRRWIKNSDIALMNKPTNYNFSLQSPAGNTAITLIGTEEAITALDSADLHASVNLVNVSISQEGTISQAFTVTLPEGASTVWVCPQPRVNIIVTLATT